MEFLFLQLLLFSLDFFFSILKLFIHFLKLIDIK